MNLNARPRTCCLDTVWVYERWRSPNGGFAIKILCDSCGRAGQWPWMAKEEWPVGWDKIPFFLMQSSKHGACARCERVGHLETHHWAPRFAFGEAADEWPVSDLCPECHREWHRVMRDWAKGQGGAK